MRIFLLAHKTLFTIHSPFMLTYSWNKIPPIINNALGGLQGVLTRHDNSTNSFIHCNILEGGLILKFSTCLRLINTTRISANIKCKNKIQEKIKIKVGSLKLPQQIALNFFWKCIYVWGNLKLPNNSGNSFATIVVEVWVLQ